MKKLSKKVSMSTVIHGIINKIKEIDKRLDKIEEVLKVPKDEEE